MLPVAEERNATALNRVLELTAEITGIDDEIAERQAEADKEILAMAGMEEAQAIVNGLDTEVNAINSMVKEKQMRIGALQQKSEQIAKLKQDIAALQDKQVEYAKETADYDTLKVAFSQSGVPHQIIRSIIPQLTATANTILGQMTGGKWEWSSDWRDFRKMERKRYLWIFTSRNMVSRCFHTFQNPVERKSSLHYR